MGRLSLGAIAVPIALLTTAAYAIGGEALQLRPRFDRALPDAAGKSATVAWTDDHTLLLGGSGVQSFSIPSESVHEVVRAVPLPDGLNVVTSVRSDGVSLVATNSINREQFIAVAASGKRIAARRTQRFYFIDSVVSGDTLFVLGWPVTASAADNSKGVALWSAKVKSDLSDLKPVHTISYGPLAVAIFNDSVYPHGGAVSREPDGGVCAITAAEPGVYCYSATGKLEHAYGTATRELVIPRMHDVNFTFGEDSTRRYREIINAQPTADGLVTTTDGPAILVRLARGEEITWQLWYPGPTVINRRIDLGIKIPRIGAHMNCDARQRKLACVYSLPGEKPRSLQSHLAIFDLPAVSVPH